MNLPWVKLCSLYVNFKIKIECSTQIITWEACCFNPFDRSIIPDKNSSSTLGQMFHSIRKNFEARSDFRTSHDLEFLRISNFRAWLKARFTKKINRDLGLPFTKTLKKKDRFRFYLLRKCSRKTFGKSGSSESPLQTCHQPKNKWLCI